MSQNTQKIVDDNNLNGEEVTSPASPRPHLPPPSSPGRGPITTMVGSVPILMSNTELFQTIADMNAALKTVSTQMVTMREEIQETRRVAEGRVGA